VIGGLEEARVVPAEAHRLERIETGPPSFGAEHVHVVVDDGQSP